MELGEDSFSESDSDTEPVKKIVSGQMRRTRILSSEHNFDHVITRSKKTVIEESKSKIETNNTEPHKPTTKDFKILGLIGEGAFGKVYHVVRKSDGEQFALKAINKRDCSDIK